MSQRMVRPAVHWQISLPQMVAAQPHVIELSPHGFVWHSETNWPLVCSTHT